MLEDFLILDRFGHIASAMLLAGSLVLMPRLTGSPARSAAAWRAQQGLALLVLATALAWLMLLAGLLSGDAQNCLDPETIMLVLDRTGFGHVWVIRLVVAAVLAATLLARISAWRLDAVLAVVLLVSIGWTGHAVDNGSLMPLHMLNQMLHIATAGLWIGGLGILSVILFDSADIDRRRLTRALGRFCGIGYYTVALLMASGAIESCFMLTAPTDLVRSPYGRLVLLKTALAIAMTALAANNRFRLLPKLLGDPVSMRRRLAWSIGIQTLLGFAAIAAVSLLGTLAPPSTT